MEVVSEEEEAVVTVLAEDIQDSAEEETEMTNRCTEPLVQSAISLARFHLDLQEKDRYIAVIVLRETKESLRENPLPLFLLQLQNLTIEKLKI